MVGDGVLPIFVPSRNDSYLLDILPFILYVTFERSSSSRINLHFVLKTNVHVQRLYWNSSVVMFYTEEVLAVCLLDE